MINDLKNYHYAVHQFLFFFSFDFILFRNIFALFFKCNNGITKLFVGNSKIVFIRGQNYKNLLLK